jgi:hypothetical protein
VGELLEEEPDVAEQGIKATGDSDESKLDPNKPVQGAAVVPAGQGAQWEVEGERCKEESSLPHSLVATADAPPGQDARQLSTPGMATCAFPAMPSAPRSASTGPWNKDFDPWRQLLHSLSARRMRTETP